jgi:2-oxoglutarate dehydrogenase E1 component
MTKAMNTEEISEMLAREFGANSDYVGQLLEKYLQDPSSVDDEWRAWFEKMIGPSPAVARAVPSAAPASVQPASQPVAASPAVSAAPAAAATATADRLPIRGAAAKIVENMEASLAVPTATSVREIPIKVLDENRRLINKNLEVMGRKRVSFTHIIAWAIVKAIGKYPVMIHGYESVDGVPHRVARESINVGVAVDVTKKDGSRTLLVPNVKDAGSMTFREFLAAYDDVVQRARDGKLTIPDFQGTSISLTNPGTLGTTASAPRLMAGQGTIVATGAIDYPAEYQAMTPESLSQLGVSKVMTITSTYDHRIIQGAESGAFLARVHELLLGRDRFYESIFEDLELPVSPVHWAVDRNPALLGGDRRSEEIEKQAKVFNLITMYRVRGHLDADIDPLGLLKGKHHSELDMEYHGLTVWDLDREFVTGGLGGRDTATLRQILDMLQRFYCGTVGYEYRHIQSPEQKDWLRARIESDPPPVDAEVRKKILWKLISAEAFERFLGRKYIGQKRFSVEGGETIIALLDQLVEGAARRGIVDVTIGMSHRGRLNVMANVVGKFCERIFTAFEGIVHPNFPHDVSDVKYHQGATGSRETADGRRIDLTVVPNPSHLEFINPIVEGRVRAKQDRDGEGASDRYLAVLMHGDAAFAGEGVVAETLNMSQLAGYRTGGTVHIIVNNQIGFTTTPEAGRSSTYCTDVARMIQAPIFHVNGDDPDAAYNTLQIALDYRQRFHKDVVIDLLGFRRHGHNEGDEPTYTQPIMYRRVDEHPGPQTVYARRLVREGVLTEADVEALLADRNNRYEDALARSKAIVERVGKTPVVPTPIIDSDELPVVETGIGRDAVQSIAEALTRVPSQFSLNPKVLTLLARRNKMTLGEVPVDWGVAEGMAFASLVLEGTPVRLSGEDSTRGTFSHRHAGFVDTLTGEVWRPIQNLSADQARMDVFDSPLSEAGVLGFDYGYSIDAPSTLVMWEAQFGDFANAAQVIIDQFIASGEAKWNLKSRLTLLLPHGYEGQGPEHSSARLERFLQLCAEGNMQVCCPSTPAQYFHMLRRQMRQPEPKPLIVMTPKSLLRLPESSSHISEIAGGSFQPVLDDPTTPDPSTVERLLLCTGKIYFELSAERARSGLSGIALARIEQLYPFPTALLRDLLARYPNAREVVWVQEEPENMGAWSFVFPRLHRITTGQRAIRYVGRAAGASTATGSHAVHVFEQKRIVDEALGG